MTTLSSLSIGDSGRVVRLDAGEQSYRARLLSMGVTPGIDFTVVRCAPLGDPIEIEIRGYRLSLRKRESEIVIVETDADIGSEAAKE